MILLTILGVDYFRPKTLPFSPIGLLGGDTQPFAIVELSGQGSTLGFVGSIRRSDRLAGWRDTGAVALVYLINSEDEFRGALQDLVAMRERADRRHNFPDKAPRANDLPHLDRWYQFTAKANGDCYSVGDYGMPGLEMQFRFPFMEQALFPQPKRYKDVGIQGVCFLLPSRFTQQAQIDFAGGHETSFSRSEPSASVTISVQVWRRQENEDWQPVSEIRNLEW